MTALYPTLAQPYSKGLGALTNSTTTSIEMEARGDGAIGTRETERHGAIVGRITMKPRDVDIRLNADGRCPLACHIQGLQHWYHMVDMWYFVVPLG